MGFRINTNIAAMNSHRNAMATNAGLDKSLNSLSSGLRINKAADDASGMTIADSLRSQAQGLGQAINNANDGVAVVQTADGALDEYINIINTVRTKAIQAASDGQNADSRGAIQNDITRLLQEANNIAKTTQFNGQKLLDGSYTNKSFHIGAYANETVDFSVANVQTDAVGEVNSVENSGTFATSALAAATTTQTNGTGALEFTNILTINGTDITEKLNSDYTNNLMSAKSVAEAISSSTDLAATAETIVSGSAITGSNIDGGATNFIKINSVDIGTVTWLNNDSNGALATAINNLSDLTGVTASIENDVLKLTAADGRNISVDTGGNGTSSGLTDTTTTVTTTATAGKAELDATASAALVIGAGELVINGVDLAGTYGTGGVADSARAGLEAAIKLIDGLGDSSIADGTTEGLITLTNNTGIDINVSGSAVLDYFAAAENGIFNSANKGTVTVYSDELVAVETNSADNILGFETGSYVPSASETLSTIDVTTRSNAEVAILIADSALKALDATRSDLGSVQNQLESTIRNISVTQVNVTAAESQIRDVDFAAESANFAKLNILAQSGSYAMSQANAVQQNVLRLLQ